jgi:Ca-activated chloride channel family protein
MLDFHFIRPLWLILLIPLMALAYYLLRQTTSMQAWSRWCDPHLLPYLKHVVARPWQRLGLISLLTSALCMILSLAGPTWSHFSVSTYQAIQPRVLLLDLSADMLLHDIAPDRLSRAKFVIHDILKQQGVGQFGLIAYSGEPFVVSPLTDDGETIDALLPMLTPTILPINGNRLDRALPEALALVQHAGLSGGTVLVLTAEKPSDAVLLAAASLAKQDIETSVLPLIPPDSDRRPFDALATAGHGQVLSLSTHSADLQRWLHVGGLGTPYAEKKDRQLLIWRDEGRWFLIPAFILLLPVFRRGCLTRLMA